MPAWMINGISVVADEGIGYEEALHYVHEKQLQCEQQKKKIARIELCLVNDGLDIEIRPYERSPITRIRRITGLAELRDKKTHVGVV